MGGRLARRVIRRSALGLCFLSRRATRVQGFVRSSCRQTTGTRHGHAQETRWSRQPPPQQPPYQRRISVTCFSMQPYVHPPPPLAGAKRKASLLQATAVGDASSAAAQEHHATPEKLPRTVTPILLAVLALIISDGIALGSLPLHLQSMGATPAVVGLATSAFSVAQMTTADASLPSSWQPTLRIIALAPGWALTLSVSTYSLFSSRFLGYGQAQLSAAMSTGAATTIFTQMVVMPPLIQATGEHVSCTLGLLILMTGLSGMSLLRVQPWHMALYLLIRVGTGITDTATATLVTLNSNSSSQRATNLGLVQSTRAAARIVTSVLSGSLFSLSCFSYGRFPGCLPYLVNAVLALALTPLPLLLKKLEQRQAEE